MTSCFYPNNVGRLIVFAMENIFGRTGLHAVFNQQGLYINPPVIWPSEPFKKPSTGSVAVSMSKWTKSSCNAQGDPNCTIQIDEQALT